MKVLVDEAHGTHFYFGENLPVSAMEAGADMASVSMHKSGGSLTQSSFLLVGPSMHAGYVRQIINLTQTTSGSYLLLSSLDISRRNLVLRGKESFARVAALADYAREEINRIGGYYAFSKELMSSLDISRRNLVLRGKESFARVAALADYAREEINRIGGYYAFSKELINGDSIYDFDTTKLSIHTLEIGLAGI